MMPQGRGALRVLALTPDGVERADSMRRLDPQPACESSTLTESDGSVVPVVWRSVDDADEALPLYPTAVVPWVRGLAGR